MTRHRIILSGGGTGGHVYPALSVWEQLENDPGVEAILYIGAKGHIEERIATARKIDFVGLEVSGLPRKLSPSLVRWFFQMRNAIAEAKKIFSTFKPTVVLGTGGYASAPPLFAAMQLNVPFAVHEPDAHPGLVNRLFAKNANLVSLGMKGAEERLKCGQGTVVVNGNPIRKGFIEPIDRRTARQNLGLSPELKTIASTGGSQGARAINESACGCIQRLLAHTPELQVIHQAGDKNMDDVTAKIKEVELQSSAAGSILNNPRFCLRSYFEDMSLVYAAADLAVCRSGAMTISELAAMSLPAVFIPYPHAAQNHQMHNARSVEEQGAALVIAQDDLTSDRLSEVLISLFSDESKLSSMREAMSKIGKPKAAADLAEQLKQLSAQYQSPAGQAADND